jgi:hypothetical protein
MIDNAREEQDVRDLSNFLALLLKGAEFSNAELQAAEEAHDERDKEMMVSEAIKGSSKHIIHMGRNEYKKVKCFLSFLIITCYTCSLFYHRLLCKRHRLSLSLLLLPLLLSITMSSLSHSLLLSPPQCRAIPRLREFAEIFSVPVCEFGDAIRHRFKAEPPATPSLTTEEAAASFVDDKYLKRPEDVLKAVSVLLANELCLEPSIRHAAKVSLYCY